MVITPPLPKVPPLKLQIYKHLPYIVTSEACGPTAKHSNILINGQKWTKCVYN